MQRCEETLRIIFITSKCGFQQRNISLPVPRWQEQFSVSDSETGTLCCLKGNVTQRRSRSSLGCHDLYSAITSRLCTMQASPRGGSGLGTFRVT